MTSVMLVGVCFVMGPVRSCAHSRLHAVDLTSMIAQQGALLEKAAGGACCILRLRCPLPCHPLLL